MINFSAAPDHFVPHVVVARKVTFKPAHRSMPVAANKIASLDAINDTLASPVITEHGMDRKGTVLIGHGGKTET